MSAEAAAALLDLSGAKPTSTPVMARPAAAATRVLATPQTTNPISNMSYTDKHIMFHRIKMSIPLGFRASHMRKARYPNVYVNLMEQLEKHKPHAFPNFRAQLDLQPYDKITYNTTTSPHVVCPRCKGYFVMRKNGRIRKHVCFMPVLAQVVRCAKR